MLFLVLIDWQLRGEHITPWLGLAPVGKDGCLLQESLHFALIVHEEGDRAPTGLLCFGSDHPGSFWISRYL